MKRTWQGVRPAIIRCKRRESTIESHCMKSILFVLLVAAAAPAAEFSTGQAARLVIGQRTFTEQEPGARQDLLGGVSGLAYAGDMLFVVDSNRVGASPQNQRVLIYKNLSGTLPRPTDELGYDRPCPA